MRRLSPTQAYAVATASGVVLWFSTMAMSGRSEAWDSSLYWTAAYPAAVVIAGGLGYFAPEKRWRWALTLMLVQAVTLAITAASFGLLPLGLILFAMMSIPLIGAAMLAAAVRRYLAA